MPTAEFQASAAAMPTGVRRFNAGLRSVAVTQFDPGLAAAAVGLFLMSLLTINGATADDVVGQPDYFLTRQAVFGGFGMVMMFAIAYFDYSRLADFGWQIYALLITSITFVLAFGGAARGSRRWIEFAGVQVQPSELGKLLLILVLAAYIVGRARDRRSGVVTLRTIGLAAFPGLLVFAQPDLGTGLVYGAIALMVVFVAGAPWTHMVGIAAAVLAVAVLVLAAAPAAGINVLKPYQVDRLTAFMSPDDNPTSQGYQQRQAQIAIGAGGRTGRGSAGATQTRLNFLPEHHTDFIFAVVGESYGFKGAATVLSLYALLLWRVLRILVGARDMFGALIAAGIAAMLMFQVFVNVGMNLGIMPITGVTLPLMSYGGSSMVVTFIALGLLQSIAVRSRLARPL